VTLPRSLWAALIGLLLCPTSVHAAEDEIWNSRITQSWLDDHVSVVRRPRFTHPRFTLDRTQVWASGILKSDTQAFAPSPSDRVFGAKLQPFHDLAFLIGTEFVRPDDGSSYISSRLSWETSWTRDWESLGGLTLGLATAGSVGNRQTGYSQSVSGTLGVPLGSFIEKWDTQFRLVPSMSVDTATGAIGSNLTSEIVTQRVLGSQISAFRSVLNLKLGYNLAPDTRPAAFAGMEIRISPNL